MRKHKHTTMVNESQLYNVLHLSVSLTDWIPVCL